MVFVGRCAESGGLGDRVGGRTRLHEGDGNREVLEGLEECVFCPFPRFVDSESLSEDETDLSFPPHSVGAIYEGTSNIQLLTIAKLLTKEMGH